MTAVLRRDCTYANIDIASAKSQVSVSESGFLTPTVRFSIPL
jgi:hypothetical protein